ncbi:MAG: metallophosphoesterase family protein [Spirochaetes bacterium]|nr:metallophosphoesterase family protein [Spirochaetota bacterium]
MKLFVIGDIHGEKKYFSAAAAMMDAADLVVLCGDLSRSGLRTSAEEILSEIERHTRNIVAVHGNWDSDDVRSLLETRGYSVHGRGRVIDGIGFFGVGGSSHTPMNTASEYTEDEIGFFLGEGYRTVSAAKKKILVTHAPPRQVRDRTFLGLRGGSRAVRNFIEDSAIDLCLAGHIHEAYGTEKFSDCLVVNSGSFKKGRYTCIDLAEEISVDQGRL